MWIIYRWIKFDFINSMNSMHHCELFIALSLTRDGMLKKRNVLMFISLEFPLNFVNLNDYITLISLWRILYWQNMYIFKRKDKFSTFYSHKETILKQLNCFSSIHILRDVIIWTLTFTNQNNRPWNNSFNKRVYFQILPSRMFTLENVSYYCYMEGRNGKLIV